MPGGTHVGAATCREIHRRVDRGVRQTVIADDLGVTRKTVGYHARGECSHKGDAVVYQGVQVDIEKLVRILMNTDEPVLTTGEIQDRMDEPPVNTQTIAKHLKELAEHSPVEWKQPSRDYLWWYDDS